jgi:hypothetical protein
MRPDLVEDEVVRSDVVHGRRRQRPRTAAGHASARPLLGHLQRFLTPQPIHPVRPRHLALTVEVSWSEIRQAGHHQSSIVIVQSSVQIDNRQWSIQIANRQSSVVSVRSSVQIDNRQSSIQIANLQSSVVSVES